MQPNCISSYSLAKAKIHNKDNYRPIVFATVVLKMLPELAEGKTEKNK